MSYKNKSNARFVPTILFGLAFIQTLCAFVLDAWFGKTLVTGVPPMWILFCGALGCAAMPLLSILIFFREREARKLGVLFSLAAALSSIGAVPGLLGEINSLYGKQISFEVVQVRELVANHHSKSPTDYWIILEGKPSKISFGLSNGRAYLAIPAAMYKILERTGTSPGDKLKIFELNGWLGFAHVQEIQRAD